MNKEQREYIKAKALMTYCKEQANTAEREFLKENGLQVERVWQIEGQKEFERLNERYCSENASVEKRFGQARDAFWKAEDALLEYALSLVPLEIAEKLRYGSRVLSFREELIDTAIRLDVKTVPVFGNQRGELRWICF